MTRSKAQEQVLSALIKGATLKAHRYLDGKKACKLHSPDGHEEMVGRTTVDTLKNRGLIQSNHKFPTATYLLTEKGKQLAVLLVDTKPAPLPAKIHT